MTKKRGNLDSPHSQGKASRPAKRSKKQLEYHSSSDEEPSDFQAVNLGESEEDDKEPVDYKRKRSIGLQSAKGKKDGQLDNADSALPDDDDYEDEETRSESSSDRQDDSDDSDGSMNYNIAKSKDERSIPKRNDPAAFSTSISKILTTKLPASAKSDPVLSRSKSAADARSDFANEKLDRLARAKLRAEKREELDRGRIRDVMGIERGQAGLVAEEEKRLRKTAQRGVIKLFNAVRAAQVRGEEAAKSEKRKGTIGLDERAKAANEISKQGFLELIGGKKGRQVNIEEA